MSQIELLANTKVKKKKTEICKNFLEGKCRYGRQCDFAHGNTELRSKTITDDRFKTKPCKNYHKYGQCPYGIRCQYLHSEIKDQVKWWGYLRKHLNKHQVPYTFPWEKDEKQEKKTSKRLDILRFQKVTMSTQLPVFKSICF